MSELYRKVEFLKGLAEGMSLKEDKPEHKLLLKIVETLAAFAEEVDELQLRQNELDEFVDDLDEDLAELEDVVFEDEDDAYDDDDDDEDTCIGCGQRSGQAGEAVVEYECPNCGYQTRFDITDFDFEEDYLCPQCHQPFFPEHAEDEDDGEDEGQNGQGEG
ncbi:MAG: hypothetical protein PHP07_02125 [Eubacteriales bacterium]|jgi:predicted RNA-binding Zn-ribbon protein involved in translation (DUF1610 family)|nr:hypothetical protein [Eubacteriales bacterium]MDD3571728.1 hypothetical protein [Eubacteriales bacterium]MDD4134827.1 hypothetical protein [Eubacteriales bacterium]NLO14234.1 hypothetical protein [Clostridiales bacterium]